jgi:hypothetical protein
LAVQAEALGNMVSSVDDDGALRDALAEHLRAIRLARHHSRLVVIALRRDTPMIIGELMRHLLRRLAIAVRRARLRIGVSGGGGQGHPVKRRAAPETIA